MPEKRGEVGISGTGARVPIFPETPETGAQTESYASYFVHVGDGNRGQARYFLFPVATLQGSELHAASSFAFPAPGHGPGSRVATPALQTGDYPWD